MSLACVDGKLQGSVTLHYVPCSPSAEVSHWRIEAVPDPNMIIPDPYALRPDLCDMKWCSILQWETVSHWRIHNSQQKK